MRVGETLEDACRSRKESMKNSRGERPLQSLQAPAPSVSLRAVHFLQGWPQTALEQVSLGSQHGSDWTRPLLRVELLGQVPCRPPWVRSQISLSSSPHICGIGGSPVKRPLNKDVNSEELVGHSVSGNRASSCPSPCHTSSQRARAFTRWTECSSEWLVFAQPLVRAALSPGPALDWQTRSSLRHPLDEPADTTICHLKISPTL